MNTCCHPSSGSGWNTPTPGQTVVVPPGSQVVQAPVAYPCHGEQATASGVVLGASPGGTPGSSACPGYPTLSGDVTFPAINALGQLRASCASAWAVPGLAVWVPPFGTVKVTGVSGDLVTFENLSIPPGSTVGSGAVIVPSGPAATAESDLESVTQFDSLLGLVDGVQKRIEGSPGQVLRWGAAGWQKHTAGSTFFPLKDSVDCLTGAGANRVVTNGNDATAVAVPLPSKPSSFNGGKIYALVEAGGKPRDTGATLRIQAAGITIHTNGAGENEGNSTALLDVTNLSAVDVRIFRAVGTGNVDGWFNILGYFA